MKNNFGQSLKQYWKLRWGSVPWVWLGNIVIVIILLNSFKHGYWTKIVLGGNRLKIIKESALNGDYQLAKVLYQNSIVKKQAKVLGVSDELEELVYPQQKIKRYIKKLEQLDKQYPNNPEIKLKLTNLYIQAKN